MSAIEPDFIQLTGCLPSTILPTVHWTATLTDLDDDSLHLVIIALWDMFNDNPYTRMEKAIIPLSLVNKRLRALTLPFMFREGYSNICQKRTYVRGESPLRGYYPSYLWQYFRTYYVLQDRTPEDQLEHTISALPLMPNVTSLIIEGGHITSPNLISAAAEVPSLRHLELKIQRMDTPEPLRYDRFSQLQQLVISEGFWPMERDEDQRALERRNISLLVNANHATLRHLEVPGQITDLFELGSLQWPNLEYFALNGYVPPAPHPPICHLLGNMTRLKDLRLKFIGKDRWNRSRHGGQSLDPEEMFQQIPYVISPVNEELTGKSSSRNRLDELVPKLKSLVVTYVSDNDHFYQHLPPALESLNIICIPPVTRGGYYRVDWPLSEEQCLAIIACLRAVQLTKLHLTHKTGVTSLALLRRIGEVLPRVERLYLEAYQYHDYGEAEVNDYIALLTNLQNVTSLCISLPFNSSSHRTFGFTSNPARQDFVAKLAWAIPTLEEVGLRQYVSHGRNVATRYPPFEGWKVVRVDGEVGVRRALLEEDY